MRDLLEGPIIYLPIRHHSPACALAVQRVVDSTRPFAVLVEGPPSFNDQIELLVSPEATMPLAIYSYVVGEMPVDDIDIDEDDPLTPDSEQDRTFRHGSYFPLCDYSPELVALRRGHELGSKLAFVDLDYVDRIHFGDRSPTGHVDERRFDFSAVLAETARRVGCRDHNELWDHMVECTSGEPIDVFSAVYTYASMARSDTETLPVDVAREAAMAALVHATFEARTSSGNEQPIVVVTGASHTVALPDLVAALASAEPDSEPPQSPNLAEVGVVDSGHGLIRYSFDRLDALAGYAAGMAHPAWHQDVWTHATGDAEALPPTERLITEVATAIRAEGRDGQPSLPSVVDALTAAEQLRRLRGREGTTLHDAVDAMVSCFTKDEDTAWSPVRKHSAARLQGNALGVLPPGTPRLPLARDFDRHVDSLGLTTDTTASKRVDLDVYRNERDRKRSRFLHGIHALDIAYGACITPLSFSATSGRDVIRERWEIRFTPATDSTLTEASMWGASVHEAVTAKTRAELHELLKGQPGSADLVDMVGKAAQRGVPDLVRATLDELRSRIAIDPSLASIATALSESALLYFAREPLGGSSLTTLPDLAIQMYTRACQLGGRIHAAPEEDQPELVDALESIHRALVTDAWPGLDHELFWSMLETQRGVALPQLRGAIAGLEWRGGRITDDALIRLVSGHLNPSAEPKVGASFLAGLITVARDSLWEVEGIIEAMNQHFSDGDLKDFLGRAPALRSAFASLTPQQTDRVAEIVASLIGSHPGRHVVGISVEEVMGHTELSALVVDYLREDGLEHWLSSEEVNAP